MAQLGSREMDFKAAGASVVLVAAEKRSGMFKPAEYLSKHPTPFPFLLDEDRSVTKRYGIYRRIGFDAINIARTATFVIDRSGTVRWIYVGNSQFDRAPIDDLLAQAREAGR